MVLWTLDRNGELGQQHLYFGGQVDKQINDKEQTRFLTELLEPSTIAMSK